MVSCHCGLGRYRAFSSSGKASFVAENTLHYCKIYGCRNPG